MSLKDWANRGIGLQLIRTFQSRDWHTIGSVRPEMLASNVPSIADLKATNADIIQIDYENGTTIKSAADELAAKGVTLDVLVNCGGIKVRPLEWHLHEQEDLMERFQVMVVGPFLVTKQFLPLVTKDGTGKLIYITSKSGSIGAPDHDGELIGYRMAKAAPNQQVKTLALDFQRDDIPITTLAFEPGFIKTRLTGFRGRVDIEESSNGMVDIIEKLTPEHTGTFVDWKGETIPW
ncbi:short chain dehydrogenase [Coniochaeta sp. PMI_546]|nr:short chain dehydrogenase [Coniochaeta sp. PMI_546]